MRTVQAVTLACLTLLAAGACKGGGTIYTLYRNSPVDTEVRIHVATFEADQPESYNRQNCQIAREHFQSGAGSVVVRYWCEKGRYIE